MKASFMILIVELKTN